MSLMKPRKLVDLDNKKSLVLNEETHYILNGRIWNWLRIGCMVCMAEDEEDLQFQTLKNEDGECYCMTHGMLNEVSYKVRRAWEIQIGDETRSGVGEQETIIYIPASFSPAEKTDLLEQIFSEYKELEEEFS